MHLFADLPFPSADGSCILCAKERNDSRIKRSAQSTHGVLSAKLRTAIFSCDCLFFYVVFQSSEVQSMKFRFTIVLRDYAPAQYRAVRNVRPSLPKHVIPRGDFTGASFSFS